MTINKKKLAEASKNYPVSVPEDLRTGLNSAALKQAVLDHLLYSVGRVPSVAPDHAYYKALSLAVRDRLQHHWSNTIQAYFSHVSSKKMACYFSAEFLMGPQLGSSLVNLGHRTGSTRSGNRTGQGSR
jgi:starch phosphorylase